MMSYVQMSHRCHTMGCTYICHHVVCDDASLAGPYHQRGLQQGKRLATNAVTQLKPLDHCVVVDRVKGRSEVNQNKCCGLSIVRSGFHGICYTKQSNFWWMVLPIGRLKQSSIRCSEIWETVHRATTCSERVTLYFHDSPVQSNTILTSMGSIQLHDTISIPHYSQSSRIIILMSSNKFIIFVISKNNNTFLLTAYSKE